MASKNPDLLLRPSPPHVIHMAITLAMTLERVTLQGLLQAIFEWTICVFQPGTFP